MSKNSGSGFHSFKRAVGGGNKVGDEEKSSGENCKVYFNLSFKIFSFKFNIGLFTYQ